MILHTRKSICARSIEWENGIEYMRVFCLDAVHSIELGLLFGTAAFVSVAVTAATRAGVAAAAVVKRMCVAHAYPDININILRKRTPTCVQYKPCPGPVNMLPPTLTPATIYKYVCSVYPMSPGHVRSL